MPPPSEYDSVIRVLASPPPSIGYYGYVQNRDAIEKLFSEGKITEEEYQRGIKLGDYQLAYFYPPHEDAIYIESLSFWAWSDDCRAYLGARSIPAWVIRQIKDLWAFDTDYPPSQFPQFIYQELSRLTHVPPFKCFDFTLTYATFYDPRKGTPHANLLIEATKPKKPEPQVQIHENSNLDTRIERVEQNVENIQDSIKSVSQKLNDLLANLTLNKAPQMQSVTTESYQLSNDEQSVYSMVVSPSELSLINRNNPANENGKSVWHEIRQVAKLKKNRIQILIIRADNESVDEFQKWTNALENKLATQRGNRVVVNRKSQYELESYSMDREGWNRYADTVLKNIINECYTYRMGNNSIRKKIQDLVIYALNSYLNMIEAEADEVEMKIDFDQMNGSHFPLAEICRAIEQVDRSDAKNKQTKRLEAIGEIIAEWEGTGEGRPALRR